MPRVAIKKRLTNKGYPESQRKYKIAHSEADKAEKRKYPKGYAKLKKAERKMGKHELMGKNTKKGKIEVESKYKKYKSEIAYHERVEHKALKRLSKRKR